MTVIWLGLALSLLGTVLLTAFGLLWPAPGTWRDWAFKIGVILMVAGLSLTAVAA